MGALFLVGSVYAVDFMQVHESEATLFHVSGVLIALGRRHSRS